jgi:hypothetical protein
MKCAFLETSGCLARVDLLLSTMTTMVPLRALLPTPVSEWTKNENDVLGVHYTPYTPCTPRPRRPRYIPRMGIHIQDTLLASAPCPRLQPPVPPAYLCGSILSSYLRFFCRHSRPHHPRCIPSTSRIRSGGDSYGQCRPNAAVVHAHAYHRPNLPQTLAAHLLASILKLFVTQLPQLISL